MKIGPVRGVCPLAGLSSSAFYDRLSFELDRMDRGEGQMQFAAFGDFIPVCCPKLERAIFKKQIEIQKRQSDNDRSSVNGSPFKQLVELSLCTILVCHLETQGLAVCIQINK